MRLRRSVGAALLLLWASPVIAYPHIVTEQVTVSQTPAPIGNSSGRARLRIRNAGAASSPSLPCGPSERPVTEYYEIIPQDAVEFGTTTGLWQNSAETVIKCASSSATPQAAHIIEEGSMPDWTWTPTPTHTPTSTPTDTPLNTATPTPTDTP